VTGLWYSPGTPVSSTNKAHLHDITEILLKVALNNIKTNKQTNQMMHGFDTTSSATFFQSNATIWFK
jgi:hypothetical protein